MDSLTATRFKPQLIWVPPTPPPHESEQETICIAPPVDEELVEEPPVQAARVIPSPNTRPARMPERGDLAVGMVDAGVIRVAIESKWGRNRDGTGIIVPSNARLRSKPMRTCGYRPALYN